MITRQIAGLEFRAHSPSLLEYHGAFIGFTGTAWKICVRGEDWGTRRFSSREEAAQLVAGAFQQARAEC